MNFASKKTIITTAIILVILGGFWVWQWNKHVQSTKQENQVLEENLRKIEEVRKRQEIDTSNWKTYQNEEFGFEVKYPGDWIVQPKDYRYWKSFDFNKSECMTIADSVCEDEFLSIDISNKKDDDELKSFSLLSWALPGGECKRSILNLHFNIDYNIQACERDEMGYKWQGYYFTKDDLHYLFTIRYDDEGYDSPIGKKIIETFRFEQN